MYILGINAYHADAAAALIKDGELVASVEEERFTRVKHWAGFPSHSIRFCLGEAGIEIGDVDHVAMSFDPRANFARKLRFVFGQRPSLGPLLERLRRQYRSFDLKRALAAACDEPRAAIRARFHKVEHHAAHLAAGYLVSPFDDACVVSVDGVGDFVSAALASARGASFTVHQRVYFPHSIGFVYHAVTNYLGFPSYGDEYKVMGLAAYGEARYRHAFDDILRLVPNGFELDLSYFTHHEAGITTLWREGAPHTAPFFSRRLVDRLGPPRRPEDALSDRHRDVAASLQRATEQAIGHLVESVRVLAPSRNLVLVGGVASNSVAVGRMTQNGRFDQVFTPPAAGDNGTAYGAAYHVYHRVLGQPRRFVLQHAAWGPAYSAESAEQAARGAGLTVHKLRRAALIERVVTELARGRVVGWFQGRMELGARALGNRSLLADPRRSDMREIINTKIKRRESFRPFAPSVLRERVGDYFEPPVESPFMERVLHVRDDRRHEIPAVVHVDGSCRVQTVSRKANALYYDLIQAFGQRTGTPVLLNTSLNQGEPIVNTPGEAIACFSRTGMDLLVIGNLVLSRSGPTEAHG